MPLELTPVSQLHDELPACKVRVRIVRAWAYHKQDRPKEVTGLEYLLVDDKGDRIQASIRSQLVSKFQGKLEEGECYMIMNFEILDNTGSFRASSHLHKINFIATTCVKDSDQIPNLEFRFNFVPFSDIQARADMDKFFIDVIGEIIGMNELRDVNVMGRPKKLLNLQLKDLGESIIDVTLWEKWAEDLYSYVKSYKDGPIILVGSLMKTKPYNGKISVQNSSFSTKLFINSPIAEITEFKESLAKCDKLALSTISTITSSSSIMYSKASFSLADQRTIAQLPDIHSKLACNIIASIATIDTKVPWFYLGCTTCFKKVSPYFNPDTEEIEAGKYSCEKCNTEVTTTTSRYKLQINVIDQTGNASFLLFDKDVINLINKSAYELLEQQVQFNRSDQIPQELLDLQGRQFVFTIQGSDTPKFNRSTTYRVYELTDEPKTIQMFQENIANLNITDQSIVMVSSFSDPTISETATDSDINTISTPSNTTLNQIDNVSSEEANFENSNSSVNATKKTSKVIKYTPKAKRSLTPSQDTAVQHSSTKPKLLSKADIKKEKK